MAAEAQLRVQHKILGIGRYYDGEKLLAFFNFSPNDQTAWVEEDEAWALASPGFIFINGERYLAFCTRTASHENSHTGMISKYKLIKVVLEYE